MKTRSSYSILLSILFVGIISMPLMAWLLTKDEEISLAEKRRLAALPELAFSQTSLATFPRQFEKYYSDHFGLRSQLVTLHNYLICSVFKVSPSPAVTVGSNNWYFFNAGGVLREYFGSTVYSDLDLAKFAQVLQDRKTWLESLGSHYLFLPVPNKSSVYWEHLPMRIQKHKGPTKYDQITGYLREKSDFGNWIDTQAILRANKARTQVYFRTDSHWNHDGVYWVYREITRRLSAWLPDMSPMPLKKEKQWVENFSGDLSYLMNLRGIVTERAPLENVQPDCEPRQLTRMAWMHQLPQYSDVAPGRLPEESGCPGKTSTALVIHDSFGRFLRPVLSPHFKKIIYVNYFNFEDIKPVIERERPDVVIDERVSRNLEKALVFDRELEQTVLNNDFGDPDDVLMRFQQGSWKKYVSENFSQPAAESAETLILAVSAGQPYLPLAFDEKKIAGPMAVEVDITSPGDTDLSLFYLTSHIDQFDNTHMEKRPMTKGRQKVYFRILHPQALGRIRLQPALPGSYSIHSITVKTSSS